MRKVWIVLILPFLFLHFAEAQNYNFDRLVKSSLQNGSAPKSNRTHFFNTKDFSYYLEIFNQNDSLKAKIFDTKNQQIHNFFVDEKDSMKLKYLNSYKPTRSLEKYYFEFSEIKAKRNKKEVVLKILNDKKRKIDRFKLEVKETEINLLPIFKYTATESYMYSRIKVRQDFLVLKSKTWSNSGFLIQYELESIQNINLNVTLP